MDDEAIRDALAGLGLPELAAEGDSIPVAALVTATLRTAGFDASTTVVTGTAMLFGTDSITWTHHVAQVGLLVVDATATRFDRTLPPLIVATALEYVTLMAAATGAGAVTLGDLPPVQTPPGR